MKRFLAVLAVIAIGAVMYVAAAPAGQQAAGPTAKQFKALKKQVAALQKQVKSLKTDTSTIGTFVFLCMAHQTAAVSQRGSTSSGYLFGAPETTSPTGATATTALDLTPTGQTPTYTLLTLNPDPSLQCSQGVGLGGLRHMSGLLHH